MLGADPSRTRQLMMFVHDFDPSLWIARSASAIQFYSEGFVLPPLLKGLPLSLSPSASWSPLCFLRFEGKNEVVRGFIAATTRLVE